MMKIAPIAAELRRRGDEFEHVLVHTDQHYDRELSEIFLEELGVGEPDYSLGVGSGSHAQQTARVMERLEPVLLETEPDVVLVPGDVNSTMAAALTASKLRAPDRPRRGRPALASTGRCRRRSTASSPTSSPSSSSSTRPRRVTTSWRKGLRRRRDPRRRQHDDRLARRDAGPDRRAECARRRAGSSAARTSSSRCTGHWVDGPFARGGGRAARRGRPSELPVVFPVHPRTRAALEALGARRRGSNGCRLSSRSATSSS